MGTRVSVASCVCLCVCLCVCVCGSVSRGGAEGGPLALRSHRCQWTKSPLNWLIWFACRAAACLLSSNTASWSTAQADAWLLFTLPPFSCLSFSPCLSQSLAFCLSLYSFFFLFNLSCWTGCKCFFFLNQGASVFRCVCVCVCVSVCVCVCVISSTCLWDFLSVCLLISLPLWWAVHRCGPIMWSAC